MTGTDSDETVASEQTCHEYMMAQVSMDSGQRHGVGRRRGKAADDRESPRVSCEETRSLCARSQADQDRISDWNARSCRQSVSPTATVLLNELSASVQHRVRGHHMIWTFRTREGNLIATIIVDGECHPVSQLHRFTVNEEYNGHGLTSPMWEHIETLLLSLDFEEVLYDAARHMTDEEMRGSLGQFYEAQGVSLVDIKRTTVGPMVDRWTVQNPSDVRDSDLECPDSDTAKALSIKLPDMSPAIPEGENLLGRWSTSHPVPVQKLLRVAARPSIVSDEGACWCLNQEPLVGSGVH